MTKNIEKGEKIQCWAYLKSGELVEYDEAVSCTFWDENPEIHARLNSDRYKYLGEGFIIGHDIENKLWTASHLARIYKKSFVKVQYEI